MKHLHDLSHKDPFQRMFVGYEFPCLNERHNDDTYAQARVNYHETCLREMFPVEEGELKPEIWYCECYVCDRRALGSGIGHIYLLPAGERQTQFMHGEEGGHRLQTYVCQGCRAGSHVTDVLTIKPHEHAYDGYGSCDCGAYDVDMDFGGHTGGLDDHDFNEAGYCMVCDHYDQEQDTTHPDNNDGDTFR